MTLTCLERICDVEAADELGKIFTESMAGYGFDRLLYGSTRFKSGSSMGDAQDYLIFTNYNADFVDKYVRGGMFHHAPMIRWSMENSGACSWSWMKGMIEAGALTEEECKVLALNRAFGITAGYTISFKSSTTRTKGALALTGNPGMSQADVDEIWRKHGQEISVISNVAHLKFTSLPYSGMRKPLTNRQREVLEWVGDGKTVQDIAAIIGLTTATIEKHLRLAREALDVETTAQAVLKASYQNQIFTLKA